MRLLLTLPKFRVHSLLRQCCLVLVLGYPASAMAVLLADLYEVVLPVVDESSEARNAAIADGLAEMLVRQSGDGKILQKLTPPPAGAYIKQYRYESRQADASDPAGQQIRLEYNGTRIMDYLRSNGIAIWGEHRAVGVVWLSVRDGRNQYLLKAGDRSLFKSQVDRLLKQRGVPAVWPVYDKRDEANVKFADVWAGFSEPLRQASTRYSNGPVLAGNLLWNGSEWSSDWTLLDQRFSQRWSVRGTNYEQVLSDAINQLADAMGKQYAMLESTDSSADAYVTLDIENVNSLAGFIRLKKYLGSLQAVQNVQMMRVQGDKAVFSLSLRSKIDDFLSLLGSSAVLRPVNRPGTVQSMAVPAGSISIANDSALAGQANAGAAAAASRYQYRLVN